MLLGNVFLGMGVSIFKLSEMGTDPFSGMVMALAEVLGIGYPVFLILVNLVLLFVEVKFGREMIGAGTVVNACLLGYIVTFFYTIWVRMFGGVPQNFAVRLALVCIAIIVMSFGVSMYQTADVGVAPWSFSDPDQTTSQTTVFWISDYRRCDRSAGVLVCRWNCRNRNGSLRVWTRTVYFIF